MRTIPQQSQIAASRVSCRRRQTTNGHLKIKMASGGAPTTILKKQPPTVESLSLSTTTKIHFTTQYKDCLTNLRSLCFVLTIVFVAISFLSSECAAAYILSSLLASFEEMCLL